MSEKPEEQLEQSGGTQPAASSEESGREAPVPEQPSEQATPPAEADLAGTPSADDAPDAEVAPEAPAAEYSATVGDAPSEAQPEPPAAEADQPTGEEPTAEQPADARAGSQEPAEQAEAAPPRKKKPSKVKPLEELPPEELEEEENLERDWYILKVQSNREKSIRDALERRMKVAGLERFFGDIIVPTEDVAEYKNGKRKVTKRKLWPGYIVVNMAINDDTWFLVRETPGIGDFTGSIGKPSPMQPHEVERILPKRKTEDDEPEQVKIGIRFKPGDRVRVKDGYFQNFEGDVESIDEANGRVTVICSIFGRSTPVELEHWQIEDL